MTTYEQEARELLRVDFYSGRLVEESTESGKVFSRLASVFPVCGSKISWSKVAGSIEKSTSSCGELEFFDEICARFYLEGSMIYVGDGATDFVLSGKIGVIRDVLPLLISIPQHHYLIDPEYKWCMCFTMEGDMAFGKAKKGADLFSA